MERPLLLILLVSMLGVGVIGSISRPMLWRLDQAGTPRRSSSSGIYFSGRSSGGRWVSSGADGRNRGGSFVGRGSGGVK
ncbi:MAG: hypothetical protein VKI93_03015 [Synechococcus sp.]|nr:hypothetical protein [Synechococcus sp.]